MQNIELSMAFFLHTRAYRDTSLLVDAFTRDYGRVRLVARGVKGKKSKTPKLMQPFAPLLISFWLNHDLGTLKHTELHQQPYWLTGQRLISGLYINELLNRLLDSHEPHVSLFDYYALTLQKIATQDLADLSRLLRFFEKFLLSQLGYALTFDKEAKTGEDIIDDLYYALDPAKGFYQQYAQQPDYTARYLYKGSSLLALHQEKFDTEMHLQDAKRLMRQVLGHHLGGKPIISKTLWR